MSLFSRISKLVDMNGLRPPGVNNKISIVLPVTLREAGISAVDTRSWRSTSIDQCALLRTTLLLRSFVAQFNQDDLADFFIVCPNRDLGCFSKLIRSITSDSRYEVVPEEDICRCLNPISMTSEAGKGWHRQQIVKLAISEYVSTKYYLTLDSDIVCYRPFSYHHLVAHDRAITNCETYSDYSRIYSESFAAREIRIKNHRYNQAGMLLGCPCLHRRQHVVHGETPVVLCTEIVRELRAHLTARFQREWSEVLLTAEGWTEYGLYYHFLEMIGKKDEYCEYAGCNAVLDLERSVWQASANYQVVRSYDADHFARCEGLFLAIQSWLAVQTWLPARYTNIDEFYEGLRILCNVF